MRPGDTVYTPSWVAVRNGISTTAGVETLLTAITTSGSVGFATASAQPPELRLYDLVMGHSHGVFRNGISTTAGVETISRDLKIATRGVTIRNGISTTAGVETLYTRQFLSVLQDSQRHQHNRRS